MRYHPLQELAKLVAGLAVADFVWALWFSQSGLSSASYFGVTMTQSMVFPAMVFDFAMFLILVHYGWNIGRIPQVRERGYMLIAGIVFTVVAIAHLFRIFTGADLIIFGWDMPLWLSWLGVIVATYLAYSSFHFLATMKRTRGR